jgi:hydrogenase maturation protein HypF
VQHHHAHALSCLADNGLEPPALALAWDGSGWGPDGTVWGGEALRVTPGYGYERVARLRTFALPGGEKAVREPRRSALGLLFELEGEELLARDADPLWRLFSARERGVLGTMLRRGLNCPRTSSVGRLFDGLAALCGLHPVAGFEGQAALALECALDPQDEQGAEPYPLPLAADGGSGALAELDWGPLLRAARADLAGGASATLVSARFHAALAVGAVAAARRAGERRVVLTGGCFQNRALTEGCVRALRAAGFEAYWHRHVPPNDGGLALGQIVAALHGG